MTSLRKSPSMKPATPEFKIIQCAHILHMHERAWSAIDIGDKRVVALCKHCEESVVGRVLSSLYKEAITTYMKPHLDAAAAAVAPVAPVAPPVEVPNAEDIHTQPDAEKDTTVQS